ncbi:hypothetical protein Raf01_73370 [Rugosimonospora africana]|uniref:Uncharacterized protein n=2 Tax=Rugosimonospora africana TaxID=556532 RepID=A0A8J3VUD8_9ACTN|nr:hypothetical protein Raf01_73370 [Rugosimonospora africana]
MLEQIEPWLRRIDPASPATGVSPSSSLHGDDSRTHPYETSQVVWHSLSHSVDHLHMLRTVLRDARVIHMYSPYSLVRVALENASAAVWMLAPPSRADRITRRLRFAASDIRNGEKVKELVGHVGPRTKDDRLDDLRGIARREGIDEGSAVKRVTYEEIVRVAGGQTAIGEVTTCMTWKICSGIAHGDFWTTFNALERVELPGAPPGVAHLRISANVEMLLYAASFAFDMTRLAWDLLDQRSRSPYA